MRYISLDLETSGLDATRHQILEFAAVIEDTNNPQAVSKLPYFSTFIEWDTILGDPVALKMNAKIIEKIADPNVEKLTIHELSKKFVTWLCDEKIDVTKKITFAGKNFSGFDRQFLMRVPNWHMIKMHHRSADVGALYWNPLTDEELPSSEICCERAGIAQPSHRALDDARTIIELIRKAKNGYRSPDRVLRRTELPQ